MQHALLGHMLLSMAKAEETFNITSAPSALSADQASRQKRYFISMMIRTLCFILTIILPSPFRWIALAGAMILPYIAVVVANAGRETFSPGVNIQNENPRALS